MLTMKEINLKDKRVMIREDFNVPLEAGKITSDARIEAALPTILQALDAGAKIILLSHLGRPKEGSFSAEDSLAPVARCLAKLLNRPVPLLSNWLNGIDLQSGEVVLCENVRFNVGEKTNAPELAKKMAKLCDVFVMDAFATAHREEASTVGLARYAPESCAGPLLVSEIEALGRALQNPFHPLIAIVGGSKVSSKLHLLDSLIKRVDVLLLGGGIANTFIAQAGYPIGKSLYEPELLSEARRLFELAQEQGVEIPLPEDVVVSETLNETANAVTKSLSEVKSCEMILDIGPKTILKYCDLIKKAKTIVGNGRIGGFELPSLSEGTRHIAQAIAETQAFSLAGGGDTIAAIDKFHVKGISYISTGGGAFLEYIEGKTLPAVAILEERAKEKMAI